MRLLVLDTALHACTAGCLEIRADGTLHVVAMRSQPMRVGHAEALMPMVAAVLDETGREGIDRIAVTTGPGSFTGLRVALSAARGLALALGIPSYGVGTLAALAGLGFEDGAAGPVASIIDARRGEVYMQAFRGFGEALSEPALETLAQAEARLAALSPEPWTLVGSGASLLPAGRRIDAAAPDAMHIARLGAEAGESASPARPLYLRAPDAKLPSTPPLARQPSLVDETRSLERS